MLQRSPAKSKTRRRARIEALDTLPVFFKLEGVRVLVIGGTAAAAWKAELLEAAGANVLWVAEEFDAEAQAILASPRIKGTVEARLQDWQELDLSAYRFAVADLPPEMCEAFVAKADAANLLHNVIDQTEHCQFQFGSIVNRSPLVIGINTNGAVPVLAQVMRQKIEALIPQHLQSWLSCAAKCRGKVLSALPGVGARRSFWRAFGADAFEDEGGPCAHIGNVGNFGKEAPSTLEFWVDPSQPSLVSDDLMSALARAEKINCSGPFPAWLTPYLRRETEICRGNEQSGPMICLVLHC